MTHRKKIISLHNVGVSYEGHAALEGVNLDIYEDDFIGIIGPNGGGKSSLVKAIMGAVKHSGEIEISELLRKGNHYKIGYMPQVSQFDMRFPISIEEVVLSGLQTEKGFFGRYTKQDRVLAHKTLEKMGIPAVMVTHSRDEVYRLCSSVCCLRDGKSEGTMAMRDFFRDPQTVTGARLSGCKNISQAVRVDDHTLRASLWGVDLCFRSGIPAGAPSEGLAVGIRAHRFHAEQRPHDDNEFRVGEFTVLEDPFEWNVSFRSADAGYAEAGFAPLLWRTAKSEGGFSVPERLYLSSEDVLLLRE